VACPSSEAGCWPCFHLLVITIARIRSDFPAKFGIPRQSGLVPELRATVVFEPGFRNPDAVRGLDGFSHLWLLWEFSASMRSQNESWSPTVRPPRLGGETRMGVFATRSPFRPNPIGLSSARLLGIEPDPQLGPVVHVGGTDLMDGTPIYDIKPYVAADIHTDARFGFADCHADYRVRVEIPDELLALVPPDKRAALRGLLAEDPRPAYQDDPTRRYGLLFAGFNIKFTVADGVLDVHSIEPR